MNKLPSSGTPKTKRMNYTLRSLLFAAILVWLASCSTDVDIYDDYKDTTIVYGILDPAADTNWIKITKAFLGPGNAMTFAQNADSNNYNHKLDARLIASKPNSENIIPLDTITILDKSPGDFYAPDQLMYYTTASIDRNATYTLEIARGNEVVRAETKIVKNFYIAQPTNRINFHLSAGGTIRWVSAENGKRYQVRLVFHYRELRPGNTDTLDYTLVWPLGVQLSTGLNGGETLEASFLGEDFYTRLINQLDDVLNVQRWAGPVDVVINTAAADLNTYIEVNEPSNSIIQEVPDFTNVENGVGVFSSRYVNTKRLLLSVGSELKLVEEYDLGFRLNR